MKTSPKSTIIRKNEVLLYNLEQKYGTMIDRVMMDATAKEKFASVIGNCCMEFSNSAKGINNLNSLNDLLKRLFLRVFLRSKETSE